MTGMVVMMIIIMMVTVEQYIIYMQNHHKHPPSNVKNSHQLSQSFPTIGVLIRITMRQEKSSLSQHVVNNDNFSNECIFISDHIQYEILPAICNPQSRRCQHMISDNALL